MRLLFHAAWIHTVLGLAGGLFYREYTKHYDFTGRTQLALVHTHEFALGTLVMLVLLALAAQFPIAEEQSFKVFFWAYNLGLLVTVAMLTLRGMHQVRGTDAAFPAISGIAGLGHILLTLGFAMLFVALHLAMKAKREEALAQS